MTNLKAIMSCEPPFGKGKAVTIEDVMKEVKSLDIKFGFKAKEIEKLITGVSTENETLKDAVIAEGRPPQKGEDGVIKLNEDFKEATEFPDLNISKGSVCIVASNDLLLNYIEPTSGTKGINVFGGNIPSEGGKGKIGIGDNVLQQKISNNIQFISNAAGVAHFVDNKITVHENRDAAYEIIVSKDKQQAILKLNAGKGSGEKLDFDDIMQHISNQGIIHILNKKLIKRSIAVLNNYGKDKKNENDLKLMNITRDEIKIAREGVLNLVVAQGKPPVEKDNETIHGYDIYDNPIHGNAQGFFEITVSEDKMSATLTCHPPYGKGMPIVVDDVIEQINKLGITSGFTTKTIDSLLKLVDSQKEPCIDKVIVKGKTPENGKDGVIKLEKEFHVANPDLDKISLPGEICLVETNDLLVTCEEPTMGIPGKDIFDKDIPVSNGKGGLILGKNVIQKKKSGKIEVYALTSGFAQFYKNSIKIHVSRDAGYEIIVSKDKQQAILKLKAAKGSDKKLDFDAIMQHISSQGIIHIINKKLIERNIAILNNYDENNKNDNKLKNIKPEEIKIASEGELNLVVAQGKPPVEKDNETIHGYDIYDNPIYGNANGSFEITVSEDKMSVVLTCQPAYGTGKPIVVDNVVQQITKLGITSGFTTKTIDSLLKLVDSQKEPCIDKVIVKGKTPENGKDGVIKLEKEFHVANPDLDKISLPGEICLVETNDLLVTCEEPTMGIPGKDIFEKDIPVSNGKGGLILGKNVIQKKKSGKVEVYALTSGVAQFYKNSIKIHVSRDAGYEIIVSKDKQQAILKLKAAKGSDKKLDFDAIIQHISSQGIIHIINKKLIERNIAILNNYDENNKNDNKLKNIKPEEIKIAREGELNLVVAQGKPPVEKDNETIHGYDIYDNPIYGNSNGSFEITVSEDKISAILTCQPAYGTGKPIVVDDVVQQITKLGITSGFTTKTIDSLLKLVDSQKEPCIDKVIVKGKTAENGKDGVIKLEKEFSVPATDSDHASLKGEVCLVEINDLLITYEEPTKGTIGKDIFGNDIPTTNGKGDLIFGKNIIQKKKAGMILAHALTSGIAQFNNNSIAIHETRDARYEIIVSKDKLQAILKLRAAKSSDKKLDFDDIMQYVSNLEIIHVINKNLIERSIAILNNYDNNKQNNNDINQKNIRPEEIKIARDGELNIVVAQGKPPVENDNETIHGFDIFNTPIYGNADSFFEVTVSEDKMSVVLTCHPAYGTGKIILVDDVVQQITKLGITSGFTTKTIDSLLKLVDSQKEPCIDKVIVKGKTPENGKDGVIKLEKEFSVPPPDSDHASLQGEICLVEINDLLVTYEEPTKGTIGKDVFDNEISTTNGKGDLILGKNVIQKKNSGMIQVYALIPGIAQFNNNSIAIHEIRDARYEIIVSKNKLQAILKLKAAKSSDKKLDFDEIMQYISNNGIIHVINKNLIERSIGILNNYNENKNDKNNSNLIDVKPDEIKITQEGELNLVIAQGKPPVEKDNETIHGYDVYDNPVYGNVDGSFEVTVSEDKMSALFTCQPAYGIGKSVATEDVILQINELGITFGFNKKTIDDIIKLVDSQKEPGVDRVIAKGKISENGKDGIIKLENDFHVVESEPGENSFGGKICIVNLNDLLLTYEEPTMGIKGKNIFSEDIPVTNGKGEIIFGKNVVQQKSSNRIQVFAQISGMAQFNKNSISVHDNYNATIEIIVSEDKMSALMKMTPSKGAGEKFNINNILKILSEKKISNDINVQMIEKSIDILNEYSDKDEKERNDKDVMDKFISIDPNESMEESKKDPEEITFTKGELTIPVAQGKMPVHGKDEEIIFYVETEFSAIFNEDSSGRIDFREKNNLTNVQKDQKLFSIHPPTSAGEDGCDIFNNAISANPGRKKDITICDKIKSKIENETGVKHYYSLIEGRLVYEKKQGFIDVRKVLTIIDLDLEVGNIDFIGDLYVSGKIHDNMKLKLTGDLFITGNIEAAKIEVEGNITSKGGIITKHKGQVFCSGDISVKFIENSSVKCLGEIRATKAILNSLVISNKNIIVKGERGSIIGGNIKVKNMIKATTIGSSHGIKTLLTLGHDYSIHENHNKIKKMIEKLEGKDQDVIGLINMIENQTNDINSLDAKNKQIYENSLQNHLTLQKKILEFKALEAKILIKLSNIFRAELIVEDELFNDVVIIFRDKSHIVTKTECRVAYLQEQGEDKIHKKMFN